MKFIVVVASLLLVAATAPKAAVVNAQQQQQQQVVVGLAVDADVEEALDGVNQWRPTDQEFMAPCPVMNALVNHGHLPVRGMTRANVYDALVNVMKTDTIIANVLATGGMRLGHDGVLDLADLTKHNKVEHDSSLTRSDAALGDSVRFNETLYAQLRARATTDTTTGHAYISRTQLAAFRREREADSRERNPLHYTFGVKQAGLAYGESALLYILLSDGTGMGIRVDWADVLLRDERFPFELGWEPRPITIQNLVTVASLIYGSETFSFLFNM